MKTGLPIALALGVITFSSPALASPTFYGVFKGGWTDLDYREIPSGVDTTDYSFSALAGVDFPVTREIFSAGIEGGATWLGEYEDVKLFGIEAAFIGKARVATGTDLFLRAGALAWDADADHGQDDDGVDPLWGLGFSYGLDRLRFRGSVDWYEIDDADVETYTLGLEYPFN